VGDSDERKARKAIPVRAVDEMGHENLAQALQGALQGGSNLFISSPQISLLTHFSFVHEFVVYFLFAEACADHLWQIRK
jgi:hypothetical protein